MSVAVVVVQVFVYEVRLFVCFVYLFLESCGLNVVLVSGVFVCAWEGVPEVVEFPSVC